MKGVISQPRPTTIVQPDVASTRKNQKRYVQPTVYDPQAINAELDSVHERLNKIAVEDPPLDDLAGSATLSEVIARINLLTETMRKSGLLRRT